MPKDKASLHASLLFSFDPHPIAQRALRAACRALDLLAKETPSTAGDEVVVGNLHAIEVLEILQQAYRTYLDDPTLVPRTEAERRNEKSLRDQQLHAIKIVRDLVEADRSRVFSDGLPPEVFDHRLRKYVPAVCEEDINWVNWDARTDAALFVLGDLERRINIRADSSKAKRGLGGKAKVATRELCAKIFDAYALASGRQPEEVELSTSARQPEGQAVRFIECALSELLDAEDRPTPRMIVDHVRQHRTGSR